MKNKKYLIFAGILTIFALVWLKLRTNDLLNSAQEFVENNPSDISEQTPASNHAARSGNSESTKESVSAAADSPSSPAESGDYYGKRVKESAQKVKETFETSHLQMELPKDFVFDSFESPLDESVAMYGQNANGTSALTYLAAKKNPTEQEVREFIKESSGAIHNLEQKNNTWEPNSKKVEFAKDSGIQEGTVWRGTNDKGEDLAAVLMKRADGKGSYLLIYNAPKGTIDANEGYFDMLQKSVKAQPIGN